jgi:hypothetical protein
MTPEKRKRGRPRKVIDWQAFDKLAALNCTCAEIAGFFECSPDTIERAVKREHGCTFAAFLAQRATGGRIALRRAQFQLAMSGNATMLIWLGKQWLAQRDKHEVTGADGGPIATAQVPLTEQEARELYVACLALP